VSKVTQLKRGRTASELDTPTDLDGKAVAEISKALNGILADAFALYLKTKNFHWHVSGPHFRSYHLAAMRKAHGLCDDHKDVATASLLEMYIDATEKRTWFLFESARAADESGH
jgi:DNA-binding ferritin-like protein